MAMILLSPIMEINEATKDSLIVLDKRERIERGKFAHRFNNKERRLTVITVEIKGMKKRRIKMKN